MMGSQPYSSSFAGEGGPACPYLPGSNGSPSLSLLSGPQPLSRVSLVPAPLLFLELVMFGVLGNGCVYPQPSRPRLPHHPPAAQVSAQPAGRAEGTGGQLRPP